MTYETPSFLSVNLMFALERPATLIKKLLFVCWALALSFGVARAQCDTAEQVLWPMGTGRMDISACVGFFQDTTRQLSSDTVLGREFGIMPQKNWMENSHANALSRIWLRFQINNRGGNDTLRLLFFPGMQGRTQLFEMRDGGAVKLAEGGLYPRMSLVNGQINAHCLPLKIPPDDSFFYLVSIRNYYKMYDHVRAELFAPEVYRSYCQAYKERQLSYLFLLVFTVGGLLVLGVFGLMQFLLTRGPAYVWYALFSFANCLNAIRALEMSADADFLSGLLPVFKAYFMVAPAAITFFYLKFAWHFLDFQTRNDFTSKWFGRLATFFGAVLLITTIVGLVNFRWPDLSETFVVWFRAMNLSVLVLGIPILLLVTRVKGMLGGFIAVGTLLLLSGGVISTTIEWGFEQKPLHEIDFPFDPKAPMCIFALLESLCFALGLGYKTKKLEIEKREAILEQERHRLRIARDLHDEMGSTLSSISILSEAALRNLQQDIDRARFSTIGERTRQVMEAMSDIVWSVNPANDTMGNVLQRMKEFASEILEAQDIRLHFESDEAVKHLTLPMEQRKDFYLLFKEAVNNAAKYSNASDVWVRLQTENSGLTLEVRDNGKGFDPAQVKRGNGLWNMEQRAERMGGVLTLESAIGEGVIVRVKM